MFNFTQKLKIILPIILMAIFAFPVFAQPDITPELGATFGLGTQELYGTLVNIVNTALGFLGVLAITFILYGGFVWMTSRGVPEKINQAKRILISAVIGLSIILLSFGIVQFIVTTMAGPGGPAMPTCDAGTVGDCSGCQRCAEPIPGTYTWVPDNTCPGCAGLPIDFVISAFSPADGAIDVIRNKIVRVGFNANVGGTIDDTTFILHNLDTGFDVIGTRSTSGARIEFEPNTPCPAPWGAWNCFDANTNFEIEVVNGATGILRLSDGVELICNVFNPCKAQFTTGESIDTQSPTNLSLNVAGNLCIDSFNPLTASADDDSRIDFFDFSDDFVGVLGSDNTPSCTGIPPSVNCVGSFSWNPTTLAGYTLGDYILTVDVMDGDSNSASASINATLRPAHCCNGEADYAGDPDLLGGLPEEGEDCGGDCALCDGAACGIDKKTDCLIDNCSDNNNLCASNLCSCGASATDCSAAGYDTGVDPCCLCKGAPIIDCVTPNDTDNCNPHGVPIGTPGNLISIWGRDFGSYDPANSKVNFINALNPLDIITADLAETVNALCVNSWTDTEIIAVVPNGMIGWTSGAVIEVVDASGMSDATNDTRGNLIPEFNDNLTVHPSLCKVENSEIVASCFGDNCGFFEEHVMGYGINILAGSTVEFGRVGDGIPALNPVPNPDLQIESQIPNIEPGKVGYSVLSQVGDRSNYLNFTVTSSPTGPHIDYLEPEFGPIGQYVTIYGSGFGSTQAGSDVTFNGVNGDFTFPAECANSYWNENYIIVKVPTGATDGDVVVTVGGTPSNRVPFNVCTIGEIVGDKVCELLPGMCKMDPVKGPELTTLVDIWGEHFKVQGPSSDVEFYDGTPAFPNLSAAGITSWDNLSIQGAVVPSGAQSGPVYVIDNAGDRSSNSMPFEVGECVDDSNCQSGSVCCDGVCNLGPDCPTPNFSTYTWSFTTGDYFVKEECGGASPVPSPSPWSQRSGGTEVCINAAIGASFKENIIEGTVNNTTPTVIVEECDVPGPGPCASWTPITGTVNTAPYVVVAGEINAFKFEPTALLKQDRWYQVTLKGGAGNITAVANNTPLIDDYIWHFKTRDSVDYCEFDKVRVTPNPAKLVDINATQTFIAEPINNDDPCVLLNGAINDWVWESTNMNVATIPVGTTINTETATPVRKGATRIRATILPDNITGEAFLEVDFLGLTIIGHWYECDEVCINAFLGLRFDRQVEPSTLAGSTGNIGIYECLDGLPCQDYPFLFPASDPETSYIWDNITGASFTTFASSTANFLPDQYYRVVVDTSDNGIKSILGNPIINPNSDLSYGEECDDGNMASGDGCSNNCLWENTCGTPNQECQLGFPGCDANCLHTGSVDTTCGSSLLANTTFGAVDSAHENCDYNGICADANGQAIGPPYEFCRLGGPDCQAVGSDHCEPVENNGCSDSCLLTGSTHTAVCGNNEIEFGEACDDNNQTNNDGCNSNCLNEGTSACASLADPDCCGNGSIDFGEDCDDNNNINNDGCNANCLSEGAPGSVCGDGKVGIGEDCDGSNGCSANCLWEGSGGLAICGNGSVEKNELDHYSWVFKTREAADPCLAESVDVIPANTTATIGSTLSYNAIPRRSGDSCDPNGQMLDPSIYNWAWSSDNDLVATVTNNDVDGDLNIDSNQEVEAISIGPPPTTNINAQIQIDTTIIWGFGIIEVVEPVPPGTPCISQIPGSTCCSEGVSSCGEGYECITENITCDADKNTPSISENNCRCCCDPLASVDPCPTGLMCLPDKTPCSGNNRGMCCGCESDLDCGTIGYCGNDTCCYPAPEVDPPTIPSSGEEKVCLNAIISAPFTQEMDIGTFRNAIEVVGDYMQEGACPENTSDPLFYSFNSPEVWCSIKGKVGYSTTNDGNSIIEFMPNEILKPNKAYRVVIHGSNDPDATCGNRKVDPGEDCDDGNNADNDGCSHNCLNEGTTDKCGNRKIDWGEDCDDGGLCADGITECVVGGTPCDAGECTPRSGDGCSNTCLREGTGFTCPNNTVERDPLIGAGEDCDGGLNCGSTTCLNLGTESVGVKSAKDINMLTDYNAWNFITGEEICDIDYIRVNVRVGDEPNPDIVYENVNSDLFICAERDDCKRDALQDVDDPTGNQHVFRVFAIDSVTGNVLNPNDFDWTWEENDPFEVFELEESEDPDPEIPTRAEVTSNPKNNKGFIDIKAKGKDPLYGEAGKRARVEVFLCNNPWPSIDTWPWEDNLETNDPAAKCDNTGICNNTFFEAYYCRDAGSPGIEDDLPKVAANPLTFSEAGDILKEFFFIEDESGSGGPIIFNAIVTPCTGTAGTTFDIQAKIVDLDGVDDTTTVAYIKTSLFEDYPAIVADGRMITLTDSDGDNIYEGSWTSNCTVGLECLYYVDIVASDTLGNESIAENIECQ